jgi:hypothetical protein
MRLITAYGEPGELQDCKPDPQATFLGQAVHTMQDAESPAHAGFQEAWPNTRFFTAINVWHYTSETFFPGEDDITRAENNTKRAGAYFKGYPMPTDLISGVGPSSPCECKK